MGTRSSIALTVFMAIAATAIDAVAKERQIIGYIEKVRVFPGNIILQAKIDTGAKTSSIDVRNPIVFDRNGEEWVRFTIRDNDGQTTTFERPVIRTSKVRRSGTAKQIRYVVRLGVCFNGYFKQAEFNLNNRFGMSYRMLIGRLFLADKFLVDASAKNLTKPNCPEAPER